MSESKRRRTTTTVELKKHPDHQRLKELANKAGMKVYDISAVCMDLGIRRFYAKFDWLIKGVAEGLVPRPQFVWMWPCDGYELQDEERMKKLAAGEPVDEDVLAVVEEVVNSADQNVVLGDEQVDGASQKGKALKAETQQDEEEEQAEESQDSTEELELDIGEW